MRERGASLCPHRASPTVHDGSGNGPKHEEGDSAFDNCVATFTRQIDRHMIAGGGPKASIDDVPTNCDHFWQAPESDDGADLIGNHHWPPPGSTK